MPSWLRYHLGLLLAVVAVAFLCSHPGKRQETPAERLERLMQAAPEQVQQQLQHDRQTPREIWKQ